MPGAPKREATKSKIAWNFELRSIVFLLRTAFEYDHETNANIFRHMHPDVAAGYNHEQLTYRIKDEYNGRKHAGRAVKAWAAICARTQNDEVLQWREELKQQIRAAVISIEGKEDDANATEESGNDAVAAQDVATAAVLDKASQEDAASGSAATGDAGGSQEDDRATAQDQDTKTSEVAVATPVPATQASRGSESEPASPADSDWGHLPMPPMIANSAEGKAAQLAWRRAWNLANS